MAGFFVVKTPISGHRWGNLRGKIDVGIEFLCLWWMFEVEVRGRACILMREMAISKDQDEVGMRVRKQWYGIN